jgi:hypothetical protein
MTTSALDIGSLLLDSVLPGLLPAFVVPGRVKIATVSAAAERRTRSAVPSCGAG